jgi:hypothetical protein
MARQKIAELDQLARKIAATKEVLQRPCACQDLAECGPRILSKKADCSPRTVDILLARAASIRRKSLGQNTPKP